MKSRPIEGTKPMRLFDCSSKDLRLALLLPGEEICIVGAIEMQCLYGQICVRATRLQGQNYDEHRFSWLVAPVHHSPPIKLICPAIEEGKATAPVNAHRLKWRIRQVSTKDEEILSQFNDGSALILFRNGSNSILGCVLELMGEHFLCPSTSSEHYSLGPLAAIATHQVPNLFTDQAVDLIITGQNKINELRREDHHFFTSMVLFFRKENSISHGADWSKEYGEINNVTSLNEFIAGRRIEQCLLSRLGHWPVGNDTLWLHDADESGQAFVCHQQASFSDAYFFGDVSPMDNIDLYKAIVKKLMASFQNDSPEGSTLVVNTLGWLEGVGAELMDTVLTICDPSLVFFLNCNGIYQVKSNVQVIQINNNTNTQRHGVSSLSSEMCREMAITAYLAQLLPRHLSFLDGLSSCTPMAVRFNSVAVWFHTEIGLIGDRCVFSALNLTLVALCNVDRALLTEHVLNMETMPFRLSSDDRIEMKCIGFGLIRAIDIERCRFYIMTPIPREQLTSVNVLARGANIDLPQQFILAQCSKDVPYVMHPRSLGASPILHNLNSQLVVRSGFLRSRLINQRAQRGRSSGRGR